MTPHEAEALAARTLAAIDAEDLFPDHRSGRFRQADRERVASDLAGLRACWCPCGCDGPLMREAHHARRYADGLRRTAALYGVTP